MVVQRRGVELDGTEGSAFCSIHAELPGSQRGLARGAWGSTASPNRALLAAGKMVAGESEEAMRRTLSARGPENPEEKGNCSFFENVGAADPWASGGTEIKGNIGFSTRPSTGEGATLSSSSPEKEQTPTSPGCPRQGRFADLLDDLGPGWDAGDAALLREARRAGLASASARGGAALEDAGGRPRRRADGGPVLGAAAAAGAPRRGRMCWIA